MSLVNKVNLAVRKHLSDLKKLAGAMPTPQAQEKIRGLVQHLRGLYTLCPEAFKEKDIENIKTWSQPGGARKNQIEKVDPADRTFVIGHYYLSEEGFYKVVGMQRGLPIIEPEVLPPCNSEYYKGHMWKKHIELFSEIQQEQEDADKFVEQYKLIGLSPIEEFNSIKEKWKTSVQKAHKQFLESKGIVYKGGRPARERSRITHCYNCKKRLVSTLDCECNICGWIICDCGACGCGYDYN